MGDAPVGFGAVTAVSCWAGLDLTDVMVAQLERFGRWLGEEAIRAGGIGPAEQGRVFPRHVADSLSFSQPMIGGVSRSLVDLGAGVGLPGVPLAIVLPDVAVTLVERSGRRRDLLERIRRILGLENVEIRPDDISTMVGTWDVATMRAVLAPDAAIPLMERLVAPGGVGIIGASRFQEPVAPLGGWPAGVAIVAIPPDVLDSPGWLLTIRP
jgi:16S rRNA (guanine527-N7)-methyltransferase